MSCSSSSRCKGSGNFGIGKHTCCGTSSGGGGGESDPFHFAYATYDNGEDTVPVPNGSPFPFDGVSYPNLGITPPPFLGNTDFLIDETGVYQYDFRVLGFLSEATPLPVPPPIVVALFQNATQVVGSVFASDVQAIAFNQFTYTVSGHGTTSLNAGDLVSLRNVGGNTVFVSGDANGVSLRLEQIARD